ncbi:MAG TPA: DnaA regulatory inactivator Hda [Burkholderiales bacterium]|nr:DnaA regulatory inactivator Hda [Burkholderiales bacterium]
MQQLILDIAHEPSPVFENFITAENAELMEILQLTAQQQIHEPQVYLWGTAGSGKTHLLKACVLAAQKHGRSAAYFDAAAFAVALSVQFDLIAIDDTDRLDAAAQIKLFNLINYIRETNGQLITAGCAPPPLLPLRKDLATRLAWNLVYQVHSLSDADKLRALTRIAHQRGFELQNGVAEYLMHHWRRDLPSLIGAIESLDRHSLQTQRPVTVPLLKEMLSRNDAQ